MVLRAGRRIGGLTGAPVDGPALGAVVLAAGMGERFGGPKQLVAVGPAGECILAYNVHDLLAAGFARVAVVTRRELAGQVRAVLEPAGAAVTVVFQDVPPGRRKPWGTGEAVVAGARGVAGSAAVAVANADDLYGLASFAALHGQLCRDPVRATVVTFALGDSVPPAGPVSRAVLQVRDGRVRAIEEQHGIRRDGSGGFLPGRLSAGTPVSMNLWGLPATVVETLEAWVRASVDGVRRTAPVDGEVLLPDGLRDQLRAGLEIVAVPSGSRWAGLTNPGDLQEVRAHAATHWESPLWR